MSQTNLVEQVITDATNPSSITERTRKSFQSKPDEETLAAFEKMWYGAIVPITTALANGDEVPRLDVDTKDQMQGLAEACFNGYRQKLASKSPSSSSH